MLYHIMSESWKAKSFFLFSVVLSNAKLHVTKFTTAGHKDTSIVHFAYYISDNLKVVAIMPDLCIGTKS